jgi:hypothetical protein
MTLCGELALEEVLDLSQGNKMKEIHKIETIKLYNLIKFVHHFVQILPQIKTALHLRDV